MPSLLLSTILCMVVLVQRILPQKVPTNTGLFPACHKYRGQCSLPDGYEVSTIQCQGVEHRQYFIVRESGTSLTLTVTPCASPLRWSVTFRDLEEDEDIQRSPNILTSFTGDTPQSYIQEKAQVGVYIISITSLQRVGSLKILATTTPYAEHSCTPVLTNADVDASYLGGDGVRVSWQPVSSESNHGHAVEYCISVNSKKHYKTECAARAHVYGDSRPTVKGIRFPWQRNRCRKSKKNTYLSAAPAGGAYMKCIGNKTSYDASGLYPSTAYYFNVFAVSKFNNRSTPYNGVRIVSKPPRNYIQLKLGRSRIVYLKDLQKSSFFSFLLSNKTKEVKLSFQPCVLGRLNVELYRKQRLIKKMKIKDFKILRLESVRSGRYFIKVKHPKRGLKTMKIGVFTDNNKFPYPKMPKNKRLKIYPSTCDSITVAWHVTRERQRYCLYLRKHTNSFYGLSKSTRTQCVAETRSPKEKIFCKWYRAKSKTRKVEVGIVNGLDRGTTYLVDVYVESKKGHETLSFRTQTASTKHECNAKLIRG